MVRKPRRTNKDLTINQPETSPGEPHQQWTVIAFIGRSTENNTHVEANGIRVSRGPRGATAQASWCYVERIPAQTSFFMTRLQPTNRPTDYRESRPISGVHDVEKFQVRDATGMLP